MKVQSSDFIRLSVVDNHEIVRRGLRMFVDPSDTTRVVGEPDSASSAIAEACRLKPNVVLMDLRLRDRSGIDEYRTTFWLLPPHLRSLESKGAWQQR